MAAKIYKEAQCECGPVNASNTEEAFVVRKCTCPHISNLCMKTCNCFLPKAAMQSSYRGFCTAEVESELRERADVGHAITSAASQEQFMDVVDKERALQPYTHNMCSDERHKRG